MKRYFFKLLNVTIALAILLGIPHYLGDSRWIFLSWMPALMFFDYLDGK